MDCVGGSRATDEATNIVLKCDPCSHKGLAMEARTYCEQCEEYMCVSCASGHTSFKTLRDHVCTSVTGSDLPLSEEPGKRKHVLSYCSKHGDKEIEWFCEKHGAMLCDTCKRITHRKCQVMSVSDVKSSTHRQPLDDVINSLLSLKCRIAEMKSEREKSAEDLMNIKTSCKDAIQQFTSSIIENMARLEKEIMADVDKVVTAETAVIRDHVQTCDSLIRDVEAELTTAGGAKKAADDVTSVVAAYELDKSLKILEPTVSDLEGEAYQVHISFQPSTKLIDMIKGVDQIGMLEINRTEELDVASSVSASDSTDPVSGSTGPVSGSTGTVSGSTGPVSGRKPVSDMKVLSSTQLSVPSDYITGSAVMPDGRMILADCRNNQSILLHPDFTIQSTLTLPNYPCDVAVYGDNAAVVTLPEMAQLQYIQVDTTLRAGHTIPTGLPCLGVAVHDGEIYVSVYDSDGGWVLVMDTRGTVTRRIWRVHGDIYYMAYIAVGKGGTLYIASFMDDHIRCYTNAGDSVYNVKHKGMSGALGMLVDEDGNLLVCCRESNDIHVLGKDGAHHRVILSSADGVVSPQSVSYRCSDQTLIVTMKNTPSCRAYKLK